MKKRILLFLFLLVVNFGVFAKDWSDLDLNYTYYPDEKAYANTIWLGEFPGELDFSMREWTNIVLSIKPNVMRVSKLTKNQANLIWDAIDMYNYEIDEYFRVEFYEKSNIKRLYTIYCIITSYDTFEWDGFYQDYPN